ncbi:type IA DNA topoisomerase [Paenibacillus flagellatus]|uniref:DNA topoisomerase n=1 Tax=Paenibacillus flagellatus TaxID=2211139 RepID=A0A2V5K1E7_9BACL|nr:type IA DNA topoisomerase [Paenibacillus flagellatus]PYI53055.1 DNA topoisomerase III [Paenibacillus flagellatus]
MKTLIIAEKPDMGRNIAAAIEPKAVNKRTHLEGERYVITWAIGHLIGLAEPDLYDDKYKKWNFNDLPIIPDSFKLLPNPRTKDQLKVIQTLAKQCGDIVNACDAGREGQLIFAYIQQHLRLTHPVKRLWISDLTPETIRRGFAELKDASEYEPLTRAARARSEADWLIGMNGSRAFTTKHNELLSVGRVQTPVLALLYDRQKQIEAFTSAKFYEVEAYFDQRETSYRGLWQGERLTDAAKAEALAAKVKDKPGTIASYEAKDTKEYPFRLYDLTLLQREANAKFGFSAKKTLDIAQALYEKHKVISYPRTNSNYVNEQNIPEMYRALDSLRGTPYEALAGGADKRLVHKNNKAVCKPAKVEDHHAILPTGKRANGLSPEEQKLYDLVIRRFLSHFYPPAEYKVHTILTEVEKETFKTTVKQLLSLGWKVIYEDDKSVKDGGGKKSGKSGGKPEGKDGKDGDGEGTEPEEELIDTPFALRPDEPVHCRDSAAKEKETQPPKPYTEGTLLKAMESAGKQLEDEELRDAMKDSGLGTPATRASVIERLKNVGYVTMQGKRIAITQKGRAAVELIRSAGVELLTSPEMTGHWERRLNEISRGQASDAVFIENVKKFTRTIIDKVRVQPRAAKNAFEGAAEAAGAGKARGGGGGKGKAARSAPRDAAEKPARATRSAGGAAASATATASAAAKAGGEREYIAACPREGCGGHIFMGNKGYGCSNYKTGCKFVIWKQSLGKTLTPAMIRSLVEKGRTGKLKLIDRSGAPIEGRIVLKDPNVGQVELEPAT